MRWRLADEADPQGALFDEVVDHHFGSGEFRGMEFLHVNAGRIINEVPRASRVPFRYTINAYRGCSHACSFCVAGETPVLMADGRTKSIADVRIGDRIYGTTFDGKYRRYITTDVLDHWQTVKSAWRVELEDGTSVIASGDHRFLSDRGWKHVYGCEWGGPFRRPHLTASNRLLGVGQFAEPPKHDDNYRRGYLCGMIRGDATTGDYRYVRPNGSPMRVTSFRLALTDYEALDRSRQYLHGFGVPTNEFLYSEATATHREARAIRTATRAAYARIRELTAWPREPSDSWSKGFLAGIFDAEGSHSARVLRISNGNAVIINRIATSLERFGFAVVIEAPRPNGVSSVRFTGGLPERVRFLHLTDPAITRKRSIEDMAIKNKGRLRIKSIEPLGLEIPMYDITTGTGDFVANGVVSHNCFARPTHEYLDLNAGEDFERKIVVKINAVERLRAELRSPKWGGDHIAMGTNTDPYQRCEGKYRLTRGIIRELGAAANPFSILTKGTLILRDIDVLSEAAECTDVRANFSIATLDDDVWRTSEPGTPHPRKRVEAVAKLNQAGIPCGVLVAPILPGLSDRPDQIETVVKAVVEAGAVSVSPILLHLRPGVREQYLPWLERTRPDLLPLYERMYPRSYASSVEQKKLSALVHRLVAKHGGVTRPAVKSRDVSEKRTRAAPAAARQLGLGV